ncbi:MAG TPA: inorganic phosphate transporter [Puia sp.]|nr:inorganic phosphate transporter [Puia sp.]
MRIIVNEITLPFLGKIDLSGSILFVFFICLLCVVAFEFVNGFHDTANAVATVIYTKALKPMVAVPWSGFFNFLGVFTGGVAVAMGILKLVPLNELMALPVKVGACMVLAVLVASIIWNLGTWYLGIPCSSSHTLIGAMIGASLAFTFYYGGGGVNWDKAKEIGLSLIMSPLFGFGAAALLMYFLKNVIKAESLFHIPAGEDRPPILIRLLLITTCTLVSFFHGSNDGQKGVGLLMLILIAFLPAKFALDHSVPNDKILLSLNNTEQVLQRATSTNTDNHDADSLQASIVKTKEWIINRNENDDAQTFKFRKQIQTVSKQIKNLSASTNIRISDADRATLADASKHMTSITDYAPVWVIATISISLGIGTMIGWKRIVLTIGEKIGKEHLNYAQGATAEMVAAATIGLSTGFGLPVSTTHVLSSGIAGAMVASKGTKNLNNNTLKNIALAWVLTLPVSIILALTLFALFHLFV